MVVRGRGQRADMVVESNNMSLQQLIIVTGFSGAGKSSVLRVLEDIGFFCVDNLPIPLLSSFFQLAAKSSAIGQRVALGLDIRGGSLIHDLLDELKKSNNAHNFPIKIFFLTSSTQVLIKRFQETRRKHPLANETDLSQAIAQEQNLLKPLMELADLVLDTDQLTIHQLRHFVRTAFSHQAQPKLLVNFVSFGFKYGVPHESNFVYDIRFLPNPYFIPELRSLDGTTPAIRDYLFSQPIVQEYWAKLVDFIQYSIKKAQEEGRFFVTISIGCTGGRHRSVAFAHELAQQPFGEVQCIVKHRDIAQDNTLNSTTNSFTSSYRT
jgi:UPF0042 nucleotide-binding protein